MANEVKGTRDNKAASGAATASARARFNADAVAGGNPGTRGSYQGRKAKRHWDQFTDDPPPDLNVTRTVDRQRS